MLFIVAFLLCSQVLAFDSTGEPASSTATVPECECYSDRVRLANRAKGVCVLKENRKCKTTDGAVKTGWTWATCQKVDCPPYAAAEEEDIVVKKRDQPCLPSNKCDNGKGPCSKTRQCESGTHCIQRKSNPKPLGYDVSDVTEQLDFCGRYHAPEEVHIQSSVADTDLNRNYVVASILFVGFFGFFAGVVSTRQKQPGYEQLLDMKAEL